MAEQERSFDLGDVLSVTTRLLVSPRHIEGVYDILDFMEGTPHMTHQIPRATNECRPWLFAQHPFLTGIEPPAVRDEDGAWVEPWLTALRAQHGNTLLVRPLPPAQRTIRDPLDELAQMVPREKIIVVATDADAPAGGQQP